MKYGFSGCVRETSRPCIVPVYGVRAVKEGSVKYQGTKKIRNAHDVVEIINALGSDEWPYERLYCLYLDTKNRVIGVEMVSQGTLNASLIHPREVFRGANLQNAHAFILVHNHPSGDVEPSNADKQVTNLLKEASAIIQIDLLDHVIVGADSGWYSFRERGLL